MDQRLDIETFFEPWCSTKEQDYNVPFSWLPTMVSPFEYLDVDETESSILSYAPFSTPHYQDLGAWESINTLSTTTETAASSPATWASSTSEPSSPTFTYGAFTSQPQHDLKATHPPAQTLRGEQEATSAKLLSRKAQNRAAQQAHRERKKKLIEELWFEIHSLRDQNAQLRKQLQSKTEMLQRVNEPLQTHGSK